MWESLFVWLIIGICGAVVVHRFYRQWQSAMNQKTDLSCGCGCTGCSGAHCDDDNSHSGLKNAK